MKAANMNQNMGDDVNVTRLFSYFRSQFTEDILQLVPIRRSVFLLLTKNNSYILKGYKTNNKLKLQEAFTATLKKEGFLKTYSFLKPPVREQLYLNGTYFGCMEYIPPHSRSFSFQTQKNRLEGINLLKQFHQTTALFEARYRTLLPKGDLIDKWKERFQLFLTNLPFMEYFIHEPFLSEMVFWGEWALNGMEKNKEFFQRTPFVILHGDVAHHNFLRGKSGELFLIDFDLIQIGPESLDYLQYANRILPSMDWSLERLGAMKPFAKFMSQSAFLYALAYPSDIFREWNRLIREKSYTDSVKFKQVMDISISQFYQRKKFFEQLHDILTD